MIYRMIVVKGCEMKPTCGRAGRCGAALILKDQARTESGLGFGMAGMADAWSRRNKVQVWLYGTAVVQVRPC